MNIYTIGDVQYWYDSSTRCWWCAYYDSDKNQVGAAEHAFTRGEIEEAASELDDRTKADAALITEPKESLLNEDGVLMVGRKRDYR